MSIYMQKNQRQASTPSRDISNQRILQSDWQRAFRPKPREQEFSQIWGLHRKLANYNTLHFRSFLAETNESILHKSPKPIFPLFWENENFTDKSGSVTFEHLLTPNFMQNIRKN